jgi:hypothetical protein
MIVDVEIGTWIYWAITARNYKYKQQQTPWL